MVIKGGNGKRESSFMLIHSRARENEGIFFSFLFYVFPSLDDDSLRDPGYMKDVCLYTTATMLVSSTLTTLTEKDGEKGESGNNNHQIPREWKQLC